MPAELARIIRRERIALVHVNEIDVYGGIAARIAGCRASGTFARTSRRGRTS